MKSFLTVLFLLAFSKLYPQKASNAELPFFPDNNFFNRQHFITAARNSTSKEISLTIFDKKKLYHAILDSSFNVKEWFSQTNHYGSDIIKNLNNEEVASCFYGKKAWYLHKDVNETLLLIQVDYSEKKMEFIESIAFSKNEIFKGACFNKNILYVYAVRPKSKSIKVYIKDLDKPIISREYTIRAPAEVASVDSFFTEMNKASFIDSKNKVTLAETGLKFKIYPVGDLIKCTYDEPGRTIIMDVKPELYSPAISVIPNDNKGCIIKSNTTFTSNSFLSDNYLYQVNACAERILISIKKPSDGSLVKQYIIDSDKELPLANSPIIQEGSSFFQTSYGPREINKVKALRKKMLDGNSAITVRKNDQNDLLMTIGSYKELVGSNWTPSSVFVTGPLFGNSGFILMNGPRYSTWKYTKTAYFKSIFNSITLEHDSSKTASAEAFDEIDRFIEKNIVVRPGMNPYIILDFGAEQVLFYYDTSKKMYSFVTFNP